jgi:hypothetical protein
MQSMVATFILFGQVKEKSKDELVSANDYEAFDQLHEEHWRSSFRISRVHGGNGTNLTDIIETEVKPVCKPFVEPRPESSNHACSQPLTLNEEKDFLMGEDPGIQNIGAVPITLN